MVTYKNLSRFYARTSAGKYQLDVHEIRAGFVAAETAFERLRHFRAERIARVLALETPAPIAAGPKLILHAFPVNTLDEVWARVSTMSEHEVAVAIPRSQQSQRHGVLTWMDSSRIPSLVISVDSLIRNCFAMAGLRQ